MATQQKIPYRPLGLVASLLEQAGFRASHFYEDLVFVEHNAFLLRMEEQGEDVSLFFNVDCEVDKRGALSSLLTASGAQFSLIVSPRGTYRLTPEESSGTLAIEFIEESL